jgi:hypothetical protein
MPTKEGGGHSAKTLNKLATELRNSQVSMLTISPNDTRKLDALTYTKASSSSRGSWAPSRWTSLLIGPSRSPVLLFDGLTITYACNLTLLQLIYISSCRRALRRAWHAGSCIPISLVSAPLLPTRFYSFYIDVEGTKFQFHTRGIMGAQWGHAWQLWKVGETKRMR